MPRSFFFALSVIACFVTQADAQSPPCAFDTNHVKVNGTEVHYFECGEGEPLILVHGGLGDFRTWLGQVEAFGENYRVISYSRRYHFPNRWPPGDPDFSASVHAEDLAVFIRTLELGKVHLIGHSYGALTALLVTRNNEELIRSLTLGEAPVHSMLVSTARGDSLFRNFMDISVIPSHNAFEQGEIEDGVRLFINGVLGDGSYGNLPPIAHIFMLENAREMKGEVNGMYNEGVQFFPDFSCEDASNITTPTLLIDGEFSPEFLSQTNDLLEQCLPDNERKTIPGASHDLRIQQPVFSEKVLPFLEDH